MGRPRRARRDRLALIVLLDGRDGKVRLSCLSVLQYLLLCTKAYTVAHYTRYMHVHSREPKLPQQLLVALNVPAALQLELGQLLLLRTSRNAAGSGGFRRFQAVA